MEQELKEMRQLAIGELSQATSLDSLNELRVKYLGKKGSLTGLLRGLGALSPEERPRVGQIVNEIRTELEDILEKTPGGTEASRAGKEACFGKN